jgi:SagB-type dehydrogenase family enzyme
VRSEEIDIAELFHENTKITPFDNGEPLTSLVPELEPGMSLARITLPKVVPLATTGIEQVITCRVTSRQFNPNAVMPLETLSRLLAFSSGFTARADLTAGGAFPFHRAAPSAGATYPLEIYIVALRVSGLVPGVYHYAIADHAVELLRYGAHSTSLARWTLHQPYVSDSNVVFIIAGFTARIYPRYGERGYRYMLLEAGHISQNLNLLATAHGLGTLCIGGFVDTAISRLIGLNEITEIPLYLTAIGITG